MFEIKEVGRFFKMGKELFDYRMMLGITEKMSDQELQDEIGRFRTAFKEQASGFIEAQRKQEFFQQNLSALERKAEERRIRRIRDAFVLKNEHILLLQRMEFKHFYNRDLVFIGVEGKRPFGNSDIRQDVAEICGLDIDADVEKIETLIDELPIAANYVFSNLAIKGE